MPLLPQLHTPEDVAQALGVSRSWLLNRAAQRPDVVPSVKVGRKIRFTDAHVEAIVEAHTRNGPRLIPAGPPVDSWGRRVRTPRASRATVEARSTFGRR